MVDKKIKISVKNFNKYWKDYFEQKYEITNCEKDEPTFKKLYAILCCCIMTPVIILAALLIFCSHDVDKRDTVIGVFIGIGCVISILIFTYNLMLYMHPELKK